MTDSQLNSPSSSESVAPDERVPERVLIRLAHGNGPFTRDEDIETINWLANIELWRRRENLND
jgi:hypothetical protein